MPQICNAGSYHDFVNDKTVNAPYYALNRSKSLTRSHID
ncbi:protein of unknown function [Shewanella benthica]|uniref:Uncharacterized protein n=1 Tax=Shewanella benthica TaxID=43661 RepID=A0A330M5X6_9GAMM|nr:protein of unknown function [Shewanella benthica]